MSNGYSGEWQHTNIKMVTLYYAYAALDVGCTLTEHKNALLLYHELATVRL